MGERGEVGRGERDGMGRVRWEGYHISDQILVRFKQLKRRVGRTGRQNGSQIHAVGSLGTRLPYSLGRLAV